VTIGCDSLAPLDVPWARRMPARILRELFLMGVLGPTMDVYTRRRLHGRAHLAGLAAPVIFVANHASHMDTPMILRSLPGRLRRRTVVAAAADYFYRSRPRALAVSLAFNTVPTPRDGGGLTPGSTLPAERLLDEGWSLLLFAEGTRSRDGTVGRLRAGAAVLAADHDVPIVPIHVSGTRAAMPAGQRWPRRRPPRGRGTRRHPVEVRFGASIRAGDRGDRRAVMEQVRRFFADSGATTTPDDRRRAAAATAARG
jgi:1-acyl-sn-glycerol-3-phosphate acyltransferase